MPTIETTFINADTGESIGQADMPAERLPRSFARETTMHIGAEDWKVIKAEPLTAEEYLRTGKLVLTLRKVEKLPVNKILFTLPTLCHELPGLLAGSTKQRTNVLDLREDDWRQIELVSSASRAVIDAEFAAIRRIYQQARVDNGHVLAFRDIHIRQPMPVPLRKRIPLNHLLSCFPSAPFRYEGVSYQGVDGLIEGGFAFRVAPVLFYGQCVEGLVTILGLKLVEEEEPAALKGIARSLQNLMAAYDLFLVDWCKPQLYIAHAETIDAFLRSE